MKKRPPFFMLIVLTLLYACTRMFEAAIPVSSSDVQSAMQSTALTQSGLLSNPGFETGALGSWTTYTPATVSVSTASPHSGSYSVIESNGVAGVEQVVNNLASDMPYILGGWAKVGTAGDSVAIGVKDYGGNQVTVKARNTTYTYYEVNFTTGSGATSAKLFLYKPAGGTAYGDDFTLFQRAKGTTYYIDNVAGNDNNTGTSSGAAWQTLNKVNSFVFAPGDQLLFKYNGSWTGTLSPQGSGAPGRPIIIGRYGGTSSRPLFNGNGALRTVYLTNQQYWEINDLEVTNTANPGQKKRGIEVECVDIGKLTHIYIRNNYVHDVLGEAIKGYEGNYGICALSPRNSNPSLQVRSWFDSVKIENNIVKNVSKTGIGTYSYWRCRPSVGCTNAADYAPFTHLEIRNNYVENVGGDGIVPVTTEGAIVEYNMLNGASLTNNYHAGIWPWNADNTILQFNEVYNVKGTKDGQAYDVDGAQTGTTYQYNYSHDNDGGFMLVYTTSHGFTRDGIIRYNISQNDKERLFRFGGPSSNIWIYNNTFYLPPGSTTYPIWASGWEGRPQNVYCNNNIFHFASAGNWIKVDTIINFHFDNNIIYGAHTVGEPTGLNNLTGDPKLVAPGSGTTGSLVGGVISFGSVNGYKLKAGSPALGTGKLIPGNGGRDYWGNTVSATTAPNIGAYNGTGQ